MFARLTFLLALAISLLTFGPIASADPGSIAPARDFLPVSEAFTFKVEPTTDGLQIHMHATKGYYLYKDKISFSIDDGTIFPKRPVMPKGQEKQDEYFGLVSVLLGDSVARLPLLNPYQKSFKLAVKYQGCAEAGLCYPPDTVTVEVSASSGTAVTPWSINHLMDLFFDGALLGGSWPPIAILPLLLGLLITAPLSTSRRLKIAGVFTSSMVVVFVVIAVASGFFGATLDLLTNLQSTWLLVPLSILLSVFAVAIYRPHGETKNLNPRFGFGRESLAMLAAAVCGALSSSVVIPETSAQRADLLAYISMSGDLLGGGLQALSLALGTGATLVLCSFVLLGLGRKFPLLASPLQAIAATAVAMLGIWIVQRVVPGPASLGLWGLLAVVTAMSIGLPVPSRAKPLVVIRGSFAVSLLIIGLMIWVGMLRGKSDLVSVVPGYSSAQAVTDSQEWEEADTSAELAAALHAAKASGKAAMVFWYARWCPSCDYVQTALRQSGDYQTATTGLRLIRFNVTRGSSDQRQTMLMNGLYDPLAFQFFSAAGAEVLEARIVGSTSANNLYKSRSLATGISRSESNMGKAR